MTVIKCCLLHLCDTSASKRPNFEAATYEIKRTTNNVIFCGCFNQSKTAELTFADSNGNAPKSNDDVVTITFSFKTIFKNEHYIKQKIKDDTSYLIEKRQNDIDFLEKDREILNQKIVNIKTLKNDIEQHYKDIEDINGQIRQHYEEIDNIKKRLITDIEVSDQINEYNFQLKANQIQHINGLVDQITQFSIYWFVTKEDDLTVSPTRVTMNNVKTLHISYDTIMNDSSI
jgi:hypothetical protein